MTNQTGRQKRSMHNQPNRDAKQVVSAKQLGSGTRKCVVFLCKVELASAPGCKHTRTHLHGGTIRVSVGLAFVQGTDGEQLKALGIR